ncbi:MAG: 7-cyano-7-deazaguanine synthase [Deltaproteobacteria bacterium]|nr:MAG: 7-cyano-7-deazaguanine synthase [Deltaproteobacteria bacterium]
MPERVCVLASGGLDSAVLLGTLARRHVVHPLYVRCGLAWERAEQRLLTRFLAALRARHRRRVAPLVRLDLPAAPLYGAAHWSVSGRGVPGRRAAASSNYLPGRNLLLAGLGAVHCARHRIPALALAPLANNPFPDATPAFLAALGRLASRALGKRVAIRAPFRRLEKAAVIRRGRDLPLGLTLSCARPRGLRHCGRCTKCAERQHAFAAAGVPDPTRYAQ